MIRDVKEGIPGPFRLALLAAAILLALVPSLLMWVDYAQAQPMNANSPAATYPPSSDCKSGVDYIAFTREMKLPPLYRA